MKRFLRLGFFCSIFIILSFLFSIPVFAKERNNDTNFEFITNIELTKENGDPLEEFDNPKDLAIQVKYYFQVPGGIVDEVDEPVDVLDHFTLIVPDEVEMPVINDGPIPCSETGEVVAVLNSIPATNELVVTFNENAYTQSGITGVFWFKKNFNEEEIGMSEPVEIYFDIGQESPDGDVKFDIDFEQPDLESSKYSTEYDPITKLITWQIDVNKTNLEIDNFGIIDSLPDEIDFVDGTLEIDDGAYVVNPEDYSYDDSVSPKILTYTFPNQVTQQHKITYKTTLSNDTLNNAQGNVLIVSNDADMTVNGFPVEMDETPASIPIKVIEKSVKKGSAIRDIDWTITVNESLLTIDGASITDTLDQYLSIDTSSIEIDGVPIFEGTGINEYQISGDPSTNQILTVNLGKITEEKEITYTTAMMDELYYTQDKEPLTNNAVLSPNPSYPNHIVYESITPATEVISKTTPSYNRSEGKLSWAIYVNPHSMNLTNVKITDTIPSDQTFIESGFYVTYGDGTTRFDDTNTGLEYTNGNDFFVYDFPASIDKTYIIHYETQIVDSDIYQGNNSVIFKNDVTMSFDQGDDAITDAQHEIDFEVLEKNDDGYNYTNRNMSWVIEVNENQNELTGVKVSDTMSADQDFVAGTFKIYRGDRDTGTDVTSDASLGTFKPDAENDAFEYEFLGTINETYTMYFETEFIDIDRLKQNKTFSIENEAVIDHGGINPPDTSYTTGEIVSEVISKSDIYSEDNSFVDWQIVVNRNQLTLENVEVIDVFPEGLELESTSIELYNLSVSEDNIVSEVPPAISLTKDDLDYDVDSRTLTVYFPSTINTAYMIKFRTYVIGDNHGSYDNYVEIDSNTLNTQIGYDNQVAVDFDQYGGYATGQMGSITITKQDAEYSDKKLKDAVFQLYDLYDMPVREVTTNENGEAFFDRIVFGKQYSIREKTPPDGYNGNEYKHKFTIDDHGDDDELEQITWTYENQIIKGDLTFTKVGETLNPLQGAVFTIFETDGTSTGMTAESKFDGTVAFEDIPYGEYYVQETTAPTGYDINATKYDFDIKKEGYVVTLNPENVVNTRSRGDITFTKVDKGSLPLQGAVFSLYYAADAEFSTH